MTPQQVDGARRDEGSVLAFAMVIVIVFAAVALAVASYASAALRGSSVTKSRLASLAAAEGAIRIALEDIRLPRTVGDAQVTSGSTTVTSATASFRSSDVGKGIEGTGIPAGSTVSAVTNSTTITISSAATATASNVLLSYGNAICGPTSTTILTTELDGVDVTVNCVRQPSYPGEFAPPAIVITGADGLELSEDTNYVVGDIYFTQPSTISLGKKIIVENGNVWYPATTCPGTAPSINRLSFDDPSENTYLCVASSATDKYSDIFAVPIVSSPPVTAQAATTVNTCTVFYPGTYTTANKPDLDGTKEAYLKSGVYYFDNVGELKVKDTTVTGGRPGEAAAATEEESFFNPDCKAAATGSEVDDAGQGVTIVLGGNSRIKIEDKGALELYAPNSGYSVVAYESATNGYAATTGGTSADPLIDQTAGGAAVRIHGNVWAPTGYVSLGEPNKADYTDSGAIATGGHAFGGLVVKELKLAKNAATDGYNLQVDVRPPQYKVLVVATVDNVSVRVVADVRPSSEELAIKSWHATTDDEGAVLPTPPGVPLMVGPPLLTFLSDTGTQDDYLTNDTTPTFTGSATPGYTVVLYADGEAVGSATSAGGVYTITSSVLSPGLHEFHAGIVDVAGDETDSTATSVTIDTTAPTISASDVVIAPVGNSNTSGFLKQGGQYHVYANAADDSDISGVTANVSSITTGQTSVSLVAGDYTVAGVTYRWRSAALTASASLSGTKSYTATTTDHPGNTATSPSASITIDNTAPAGSITSPTSGATLSSPQTVAATASDATAGVYSVELQYKLSSGSTWTSLGVDTSSPYSVSWDTSALTGASYDVRGIVTDNAGNTVTSATVTTNGIPPATPSTPVLDPASDSGTLGDLVTSDDTPTFTGTAPAGTTVKLYDGATQRGSATAAADGSWSITTTAMTEASHDITATSTNAGGLVSPASGTAVTVIDKTDPTNTATSFVLAAVDNTTTPGWVKQGGQYYVYANPTDGNSGIASVTANVTNFTSGTTAAPMTQGNWTIAGVTYTWRTSLLTATNPLSSGSKALSTTATDRAGNVKVSPNVSAEVDNTAPSGSLTTPSNNAVVPASVTVSSNSNDGKSVGWATFQWSVTGAATWNTIGSADTTSPYSVTWDTSALTQGGAYDLRVITTDSAGNTFTSATITVTVDKIAPDAPSTPALAAASDTGVLGDNITKLTTPSLTGTAEAGTTVKLYDGAALVGSATATAGSWSITTSALSAGAHSLTATSTDAAGNVSVASAALSITVDATAPTVTGAVMANGTGVVRRLDQGDTASLTFSENLIASTWCSAWTDNTSVWTLTDVTLTVVQDGSDDQLTVSSPTCSLSLGLWDTRGDYVTTNVVFTSSTLSWNPTTSTLTLTVGTYSSGTLRTSDANVEKMEYTPTGSRTDIAGNAMPTTKYAHATATAF